MLARHEVNGSTVSNNQRLHAKSISVLLFLPIGQSGNRTWHLKQFFCALIGPCDAESLFWLEWASDQIPVGILSSFKWQNPNAPSIGIGNLFDMPIWGPLNGLTGACPRRSGTIGKISVDTLSGLVESSKLRSWMIGTKSNQVPLLRTVAMH